MPQMYQYPVTDTANDAVNLLLLTQEVAANADVSPTFETAWLDNNTPPVDFFLCFASALSAEDKTTLDGIVAAHTGAPTVRQIPIQAVQVVSGQATITSDSTWELLGGIVTRPSYFGDPSQMIGLVTGCWNVDNTGGQAQLRLVEDDGTTQTQLSAAPFDLPAGESFSPTFQTDVAPSDLPTDCHYRLEGRLNGAASATVSHVTVTMVHVI